METPTKETFRKKLKKVLKTEKEDNKSSLFDVESRESISEITTSKKDKAGNVKNLAKVEEQVKRWWNL